MLLARLLGIRATNNFGTCITQSRQIMISRSRLDRVVCRIGERHGYRIRWLVGRGNCEDAHVSKWRRDLGEAQIAASELVNNVRSLLSSEALENDLGVAIDAQVVNGLRVR
jgi:hypothetical protein